MSSLNGFNGQHGGSQPGVRPGARPLTEQPQGAPAQSNWQQHPQSVQSAQLANQWGQAASQADYAQQGYGAPSQQQGYAQQPVAPASPYGGMAANPDPFAPSFEPYTAAPQRAAQPGYQPAAPQQGYQPQAAPQQGYGQHLQGYGAPDPRAQQPQWPSQPAHAQPAQSRGLDVGSYLPQSSAQSGAAQANASYRGVVDPRQHDSEPALSDWSNTQQQAGHQQAGYQQTPQGYDFGDAHGGGPNDMGFAQASGGELEQGYAEDDDQEFEAEQPSRFRRPVMIAAALAGAIVVGAGFSYGYKSFLGGGASGNPPMIKSASEPSKTKPADAGGKQFAHSDSKIMGRLGDGDAPAAASASGDADASGTRKVSTVVVGRDGSIQAPAATPAVEQVVAAATPAAPVPAPSLGGSGVPGMTLVDALGPKSKTVAAAVAAGGESVQAAGQQIAAAVPTGQKLVVAPPAAPVKPVTLAKAAPEAAKAVAAATTGSIEPQAAAPVIKKPAAKKVAAATPVVANDAAPIAAAPVAAPVASGGTSGFVAVLASVPRSASSRMDALKRFADMQQKYGAVLGGKTPDVAEANLGAKGAYHRLVVGPPASREQASATCAQLKAQGYADCWVTSY
jgi:SPOR domain